MALTVSCSPNVGEGWVDSGQLKSGMRIENFAGGALVVESLVALQRNEVTYNFTVGDFHTYFVGGQRALVHNCTVTCKIGDLKPMMDEAHRAPRPSLQRLSDDELLDAARNPKNEEMMSRSTETGQLVNGSGRAHELQRRAADPNSKITNDTTVPVEDYVRDVTEFWDFNL